MVGFVGAADVEDGELAGGQLQRELGEGGASDIGGAGALRELKTAGDVVVVQMGFEDDGEGEAAMVELGEDAIDVALRVDDRGGRAVGDHVAAVAERLGLDGEDLHDCSP